jgi:hypothetical protein
VILSTGNSGESRSVLSDDFIDGLKYLMTFSGPGGETITRDAPGGSISVSLVHGDWTITANAYEPGDTAYASVVGTGQETVMVGMVQNQLVTLLMDIDTLYEATLTDIHIHNETELLRLGAGSGVDGLSINRNITFHLENSITLTRPWTPIGDDDAPFEAVFDGNGRTITIRAFSPDALASPYLGFIGRAEGGEVKNLNLRYELEGTQTGTAAGRLCIGGAAGSAAGTSFDTVTVSGTISVTASAPVYIGGIAGEMGQFASLYPAIRQSSFTGTVAAVSPEDVHAGGIFGHGSAGGISGSYAAGTVSAESSAGGTAYAGGIAGGSSISRSISGSEGIENCYAYTAVTAKTSTGEANAGGIVGDGYGAYIAKCYAAGSVKGEGPAAYAGGIAAIGGNSHDFENCMVLLTILDGGASADVHTLFGNWATSTTGTAAGSKVWDAITITRGGSQYTNDGFPLLSSLALDPIKDIDGIPAFTPAALFKEADHAIYTAVGWTFGTNPDNWKWLEGYDYPVLAWQTGLDLDNVPDDIIIVWS